jgi:tetrahydromethanopterin S-methyltransferase subunit H
MGAGSLSRLDFSRRPAGVTGTALDVAMLSVWAAIWLLCALTLVLTLVGRLPLGSGRTTPVRLRLLITTLALATGGELTQVAEAWNWSRDVRLCLDLVDVLLGVMMAAVAIGETRRVVAKP